MRATRNSAWRFVLRNAVVWLMMVVLLVAVPELLLRWCPLTLSRAIGWAVAYLVWTIAVEQAWRARFGTFTRFVLQLLLWVGAAILATWVSDQLHM